MPEQEPSPAKRAPDRSDIPSRQLKRIGKELREPLTKEENEWLDAKLSDYHEVPK